MFLRKHITHLITAGGLPRQAPEALQGRITYIYPDIDPQTRRVKVRAEFQNPRFEFKPETYVTLVITSDAGRELALPKEAVIDTGVKRYVILAHPNGYFEPREVEVGEPVDQFYPVIKGLSAGDRVVTSAQFLIDSETNLQAALGAMASMPGMSVGGERTDTKSGGATPATPGAPTPSAPERGQHKQQ